MIRALWAFVKAISPIVGFYAAVAALVTYSMLRSDTWWFTTPAPKSAPSATYLPDGSDTVPHEVSCYVRNGFANNEDDDSEGEFCQPTKFDI